ncbi:MAG: NADH-quinone oxidoreductase subunit L [Candidatus Sericytochromatia bacterium]|nr:NADH-quinone oxidoreductase subunit L [Candidatus Sericytochromatia bacterium]
MPDPTLALFLVPLAYALAALIPLGGAVPRRWRLALGATGLAMLLAPILGIAARLSGGPVVARIELLPGLLSLSARSDTVTGIMLTLVTTIAAIILRFSRRYLDGEAGQSRFVGAFLTTMAAVTLLVITNNLLVLTLAWTTSSLALYQLIAFYGDRPQAIIAAHKKFLLIFLADLGVLGGTALIWQTRGTLEIDGITRQAAAMTTVPASLQAGGILLAIGVVLRAAQLPFHGWLIQVMEAPTPVSALLHAGIVNIGGFVMIRLGLLMDQLPAAQTLLVVVGSTTAVLAGLVMMTRDSIKVALAWSTCAQMGFMLVECGLGAYQLALLHLVAHSIYKAHAFLSSGQAVESQLQRTMMPTLPAVGLGHWVGGAAAGAVVVVAVAAQLGIGLGQDGATTVSLGILALALGPLFVRAAAPFSWRKALALTGMAAGLVALYAGWHALLGTFLPALGPPRPDPFRLGWVAVAFTAGYGIQAILQVAPHGRLARWLYPWAFAGFYVDDIFTLLTFTLWPPALPPSPRTVPDFTPEGTAS